jgi:hypothetical protein
MDKSKVIYERAHDQEPTLVYFIDGIEVSRETYVIYGVRRRTAAARTLELLQTYRRRRVR